MSRKLFAMLVSLTLAATIALIPVMPAAAMANNDDALPPAPIVVTTVVYPAGVAPDSIVPGPGGNSVTITNRYYPYYGGQVKSDGWAQGNFSEPSGYRYSCESHVYNSAGQNGTYTWSYGSYGGSNCPTTPQAMLSGGVVPTTYTSWTKSWWEWSNLTSGYGIAQQSHYES